MHKRHTKVTRSQEQEVRDMLERGKAVLAIVRETGISRTKIYEVWGELGTRTPRKSPQEVAKEWFETLPNRAECVLGVRAYIHQVEAATGMGTLDHRLSYGPAEELIIDSISAHDVEVASAMGGYTESKEAEWNMATSNSRLTIRRADDDWNWEAQGMDRKEVQAKANQLIEALRPYSTL